MRDQRPMQAVVVSGGVRDPNQESIKLALFDETGAAIALGGGGGGGLVVGPWADIDYVAAAPGTFPVDPTVLDFAASSVPWEFWMNFIRTAPGINGFAIMDPVGGDVYDADNKDEADSPPGKVRAIIPAGVAVQLYPYGDTSSISIDLMKRRTLG